MRVYLLPKKKKRFSRTNFNAGTYPRTRLSIQTYCTILWYLTWHQGGWNPRHYCCCCCTAVPATEVPTTSVFFIFWTRTTTDNFRAAAAAAVENDLKWHHTRNNVNRGRNDQTSSLWLKGVVWKWKTRIRSNLKSVRPIHQKTASPTNRTKYRLLRTESGRRVKSNWSI